MPGFGFGMIVELFAQGVDFEQLYFVGLELGIEDEVKIYFRILLLFHFHEWGLENSTPFELLYFHHMIIFMGVRVVHRCS